MLDILTINRELGRYFITLLSNHCESPAYQNNAP